MALFILYCAIGATLRGKCMTVDLLPLLLSQFKLFPRFSLKSDNMPATIGYTQGDTVTNLSFAYNHDNKRAKKSVDSGKTTFYPGDHFQVEDNSGTIALTNYIFAGNLRIAKIKDSVTQYFHKDHLGSSTVMTDTSGAAIETTAYLPYGYSLWS